MRFEEALIELRKGKIITSGNIELCLTDESEKSSLIHRIIYAEWFILEEPGKTFPEVFEAFKEGKKIKRKDWRLCDYLSIDTNICSVGKHDLLASDWEIID